MLVYTKNLFFPILQYDSEVWCLTEDLYNELRLVHYRCVRRAMCRVNRTHAWKHQISSDDLLKRTDLKTLLM